MPATALIKEVFNVENGFVDLEAAMVAQVVNYSATSMQIYEISNHSEVDRTCVIGSYLNAVLGLSTPFCAVNLEGAGVLPAGWIISDFESTVDPTANPLREQGGLFGLVEIPSTSANFGPLAWIAVGHAPDDSFAIAPGDDFLSPIIVGIESSGASVILVSEVVGALKPSSWNLTNGGADTTRPFMLCDVCYDAENDCIVPVGSVFAAAGTISYGMIVEMVGFATPPTYSYSINYGLSDGAPTYPAFWRSCAIQTQDAAGSPVSTRTIVTVVGYAEMQSANPALIGRAVWVLYQPNFSNAWAAIAPRMAFLDRGVDDVNDLYNLQGLTTEQKPNDLTLCKRMDTDGEDIYLVSGMATDGLFVYALSGLTTDSTGGGDDNIINPIGVTTTCNIAELTDLATQFRANDPIPGGSVGTNTVIWDAMDFPNRKTKLYLQGFCFQGINAPISLPVYSAPEGKLGSTLLAVSRGLLVFSFDVHLSEQAKNPAALDVRNSARGKMDIMPLETTTKLMFATTPYRSGGGGTYPFPQITEADIGTGHTAKAWFEYLMYDGVDALIARKLHDMGVRVTIANVEWYKQTILKQKLDVSTDFFTEWASLQEHENKERDRLNELFGQKRPKKRQTRTEIFDDYADMEEKEAAVKDFPDYDPFKDGEPFKDDVAKEQEMQKTQKAVDDLRRIEDKVDEIAEVESEEREQDDAYDIGDNEEP